MSNGIEDTAMANIDNEDTNAVTDDQRARKRRRDESEPNDGKQSPFLKIKNPLPLFSNEITLLGRIDTVRQPSQTGPHSWLFAHPPAAVDAQISAIAAGAETGLSHDAALAEDLATNTPQQTLPQAAPPPLPIAILPAEKLETPFQTSIPVNDVPILSDVGKVHLGRPNVILGLQSPDQREAWSEITGVLAFRMDCKPADDVYTSLQLTKEGVSKIAEGRPYSIGIPTTTLVEKPANLPFLVYGMPTDLRDALLGNNGVHGFNGTGLIIIPNPLPISSFVASFEGVSYSKHQGMEATNVFRNALYANVKVRSFFTTSDRGNIPSALSPLQALQYVLASMVVKPLELLRPGGLVPITIFNVYMINPSNLEQTHNEWITGIHSVLLHTTFHGSARARSSFFCPRCKSIDHPGGLCPFPTREGWEGPPPRSTFTAAISTLSTTSFAADVAPAAPTNTRSQTTGRGNGRGRGRGSSRRA